MRPYATLIVLSLAAALVALGCMMPRATLPKQPAPVPYCALSDNSFAPCANYVGIEHT